MNIKIGDYQITSDNMQFIVNKIGIVQESRLTKAENVGKETIKPIAYCSKFKEVLGYVPDDVLKSNDNINTIMDKLNAIQEDMKRLKEYPKIKTKELNDSEKLELINTMEFIDNDADGECCNSVSIEDNEKNREIINKIGFDNDYIDTEMILEDNCLNIAVIAFKYCNWWEGDYFLNQSSEEAEKESISISKTEYENLLESYGKLNSLENHGVDNWDGYEYAMASYREEYEEVEGEIENE